MTPPVVPSGRLSNRNQPRLRVDELTLRQWRFSDVPGLVEAYRDEAIQRWHVRSMNTDDAYRWIASRRDRWSAEKGADWAILDCAVAPGHEVLSGRMGLRWLDLAEGLGEVAYWVVPAARGRQVAPRALLAITEWFFTEVGLHRIELAHSTRNTASCRVAVKAGYAYEGTRRQATLHADGWHDMHLHARVCR